MEAQTLTCKITGVTDPVEVTWVDMNKDDITDGEGGYTISQGSVNGDLIQEATLTISPDTLRDVTNYYGDDVYYYCAAKSTKYHESRQSNFKIVEAQLLRFGTYSWPVQTARVRSIFLRNAADDNWIIFSAPNPAEVLTDHL